MGGGLINFLPLKRGEGLFKIYSMPIACPFDTLPVTSNNYFSQSCDFCYLQCE